MNVDKKPTRHLTYDEKKAADAAFRGAPFNSDWSESARKAASAAFFSKLLSFYLFFFVASLWEASHSPGTSFAHGKVTTCDFNVEGG